ncbi:17182_t:CDS:1, partial [Cetraspora pellucida]
AIDARIIISDEIKALKAAGILVSTNGGTSINGSYGGNSTSGSGRSTPLGISGRETPSYQSHLRRPSTPLSINMAVSNANPNHKDVEVLEEQLSQLQRSYIELSQKYAKNSDELGIKSSSVKVQQNESKSKSPMKPIKEENISASFQEAVEPVIEEYEKSISALESQLALTRAALTHSENTMQEQEQKLNYAEQANEQNKSLINDLRNKVARFNERETTTEHYIKDLESKLESQSMEQQKDQDLINELKNKISQLKSSGNSTEGYIQSLESRLSTSEEQLTKFRQNVGNLERRLQDREAAYQDLENRMKLVEVDDKKLLLNEIDDRDKRITQLEQKVDLLIKELDRLREFSNPSIEGNEGIDSHERSVSELSTTSNYTLSTSRSITPQLISEQERMSVVTLEARLSELQKTHDNTVKDFNDMKDKYQACVAEINDLRAQLSEREDSFKSTSSTPITPMSPTNSSSFRFSLPPSVRSNELSKEALHKSLDVSKRVFHRKARSLSEIKGPEKRDPIQLVIMQKLNTELKQLSSLRDDKDQGLVTIKQEFARLEMCYRETLELVEELREEIKRRDALAQLEVMSVVTSDHTYTEGYSPSMSEIDKLDIVQRLREEVEQLKEEQRLEMEFLSEHKKDRENVDQVSRIESNEPDKQSINSQGYHDDSRPGENADASKSENEDDEFLSHQRHVEKLQVEIESKSHTIAALLLPTEYQNTIRRLEDELQEVKEAHRIAMKEKYGKLNITIEAVEDNVDRSISQRFTSDATSSDKLEQNVDENVMELEDKVKELEIQLTKAKEAQQHIPTPSNSWLTMIDPAQKSVNTIQTKLSDLQRDLANKSDNGQDLKVEQELVSSIQVQLETLIADIKRKYELIDNLKRDLVDKGTMQQKVKEKEAEASVLKVQLIQFEERNKVLMTEIEELQTRIRNIDPSNSSGELLQELKDAKEKESLTLNRLKTLKSEEENLRKDIERMQQTEIVQREKITVLEARLIEKGSVVDENIIKIRTELALAKEAEIVNNRTITDLESKLNNSTLETVSSKDTDSLTTMKDELSEAKATDSYLRKTIQELEIKLSTAEKQSTNLQSLKEEITISKNLEDEQKSIIEQLQVQIQEMQESKEEAVKELQNFKGDFEAQKDHLEKQSELLKELQSDLEQAK